MGGCQGAGVGWCAEVGDGWRPVFGEVVFWWHFAEGVRMIGGQTMVWVVIVKVDLIIIDW